MAISPKTPNDIAISVEENTLFNTTVTIAISDWSSNSCTKTVQGMTADKIVWIAPVAESNANYASAGVYCSNQGTNSLTFACKTVPVSSLTVNIVFN